MCSCTDTFKTNYKGLYLRLLDICPELDAKMLPPSSINIDKHVNVKFDYTSFRSENISRYFYDIIYDDMTKNYQNALRDFFTAARKTNMGLFVIDGPHFGLLRGQVLSILRCEERILKVTDDNSFCTQELQAYDKKDSKRVFVDASTNVIQNSFVEEDCADDGLGDIYLVRTNESKEKGTDTYIIQEKKIEVFDKITGSVVANSDIFSKKLLLESQIDYKDFSDTGIYPAEYIEARARYIQRFV